MTHAGRVRTAVIDDEPLARGHLISLLDSEPDIEVVGEAGGGSSAIQLIGSKKPDLVFLDIQMPGCDGFDVLSAVAPTHFPVVVFVTAYDAYAIRAFDVAAVDYLLKPVMEPRFRAATRRAVERVNASATNGQWPDRIPIRVDGCVTFVNTADIDWIDAADDEVRLHVGSQTHTLRETMAHMESRLPMGFVRIHRSTIVNAARIKQVQPWFKGDYLVVLSDGTRLTSGRTYRDRLQQLIG